MVAVVRFFCDTETQFTDGSEIAASFAERFVDAGGFSPECLVRQQFAAARLVLAKYHQDRSEIKRKMQANQIAGDNRRPPWASAAVVRLRLVNWLADRGLPAAVSQLHP